MTVCRVERARHDSVDRQCTHRTKCPAFIGCNDPFYGRFIIDSVDANSKHILFTVVEHSPTTPPRADILPRARICPSLLRRSRLRSFSDRTRAATPDNRPENGGYR